MSERKYPEIEFVSTDTEAILTELIMLYEEITGRTLYPASPERLFISWCAAVIIQQRVIINETAKKNVPRYADGKYLDSLAELFKDTERLPASKATATFRCYISEEQTQSVLIPAGTRVTADGQIMFATTNVLEIPAGSTYGDVEAECQTAGTVGNGYTAGQVKEIVDVYDYYKKIENITTTGGGAEEESDDSYYERMRESMESFSTAGPTNGYIYFAKSVSSAISDVVAISTTPGVVDIRILLQDGQQASETVLQEVKDALTADKVRPLTDNVVVSTPNEVPFNVDVTFYIPQESSASSTVINKDAKAAVDNYVRWQTEKMGRDINPSKLVSMLMAAGVKRAEVREPTFVAIEKTSVARIGTTTVLNGGIENA